MNKNRRRVLLYILIVLVFLNAPVLAAEDIMSLEEVEAGMTGYGKTVFSGNEIEKFEIEVIDVLDNRSLDEDLILIKLTGDKAEEFGGIAAGMSGSPIYIEDRLIGAIGYGWNNSSHRYGLVTPIERMLKLLDKNDVKARNDNLSDLEIDIDKFTPDKNLIRSSSPIMVSGIKGRALDRLEKTLSELNLKVVPSSGIKEEDKSYREPKPGEAIAVQLVRGDISVASIGTLTYIDQGNFLAFGHPFTNRGNVNYLLSRANISAVIPSSEQPFKLGSPYHRLLGSVTQDRGAGIAGRMNSYPHITPLYINISENGELLKEVSLQIINDEYLFSSLANNSALQAVDSALDRIGPGSAESRVKIMGRGLPQLQIESTDMYYSQNDIGSMALSDFSQLLDLILTNPFKEINLIDIRLELDFQKKDSVALIQEAKVLNEEIYPGDELEVEVILHRYRNGTETKTLTMKVPEDVEPGIATLFIDGGYTGETMRPENTAPTQSQGGLNEAEISGHKSFESILNAYLESPDNNDLILQLYPSYAAPVYQESSAEAPVKNSDKKKQGEESKEQDPDNKSNQDLPAAENEIKETFATEYVLEGSLNLDLEILNPAETETAADSEAESSESDSAQAQGKTKNKQ
ncbi:SpoIVB peptidase S55 [Halanaerobium congolense]|uniref:SpoIVB peptidase S55 n=1 Tax=Halanaerobium congolense TaxID=54121 RepID=A0A1H9ZCI3_9FIRM|nr:SpoIVB peptidase S55 domain-containing protein [Halanaerobium congolense]PTX15804.1 SpoIVB peptidase S55 [Halanaerobium congolense]SDF22767.1 SpoIVB peptidase S55 [Halanaerobium congolense]SES79330.1 SpoIVB peptidase S55 [Halanaerobium congolense]SFP11260.1 SpoIVB peptidase S55 [Halanaerobium congolense]